MLWCYILLLHYLPLTLSHSTFDKRQAVASKACGDRDQTVGICSPSSTDSWYNNTYHELTWNYNNPVFNGFETLTFYLLQQNGSSDYQQIKSFDVVHAVGVQVVLVDDTWYPSPLPANSPNVTRTVFTYLIGSGVDLHQELDNALSLYPRPSRFTMIQNAHNTTKTGTDGSASASASSSPINPSPQNTQGSSSLPAWAIAIITIAAVAVVIAAVAFAWLLRNMRRNRQRDHQPLNKIDMDHDEILDDHHNNNEMSGVGNAVAILGATSTVTNNNNSSNHNNSNDRNIHHQQIDTHDLSSSIHSSTPMMHGSVRGSPTVPSPSSIERSPSITTNTTSVTTSANTPNMNPAALHLMQQQHSDGASHQASSILSSTDALMIADTFRHLLRKPNWSAGTSDATLEDSNETDEEKRKRVGNELLQQQLAKEEGTTVKDIERR